MDNYADVPIILIIERVHVATPPLSSCKIQQHLRYTVPAPDMGYISLVVSTYRDRGGQEGYDGGDLLLASDNEILLPLKYAYLVFRNFR